jgi:F0F1-type ATP synthase membrane subunit b/b'
MDTLHALGGIVLKGLPTFFLILILHFYLKRTFFSPLGAVLKARYDATEGARKQAEASFARAEAKAAEYEEAIRAARNDLYKEQEQARKGWTTEQAALIADARAHSEALILDAKASIAAEVATSRQSLFQASEQLAAEISDRILRRTA